MDAEAYKECLDANLKGLIMGGADLRLAVCSAICPASFGRVLPICMGQNILANESIIFMPFIL
jgi:hypothetical protein